MIFFVDCVYRTAEEWENATYVGKCNVTDLNDKTAVPHDSDPDLVNALFASGLIAQLMIKFFVIQFIFHLMAFLEPLCTNSGQVIMFFCCKCCGPLSIA